MWCWCDHTNIVLHVHRDQVRGLAVSPCEEQHQALRLGEKSEPRYSHVLPLCSVPNAVRIEPTLLCLCLLQYVVVSSKKILFYNSEQDKELSNPYMVLDIEWGSSPLLQLRQDFSTNSINAHVVNIVLYLLHKYNPSVLTAWRRRIQLILLYKYRLYCCVVSVNTLLIVSDTV